MNKKRGRIRVVVGIIANQQGQLLVAKRPSHMMSGGYWEFPGGKVEAGETDKEALIRELKEEVNINVISTECFLQFNYESWYRSINLNIWQVNEFTGKAFGNEGQEIQWLYLKELHNLKMLPANSRVLAELEKRKGKR